MIQSYDAMTQSYDILQQFQIMRVIMGLTYTIFLISA